MNRKRILKNMFKRKKIILYIYNKYKALNLFCYYLLN